MFEGPRIVSSAIRALGTAILLAGCAAEAPSASPAYRAGYDEGCESGHADAGREGYVVRYDAKRLGAESAYREGWAHGYLECLGRARHGPRDIPFAFPVLPLH